MYTTEQTIDGAIIVRFPIGAIKSGVFRSFDAAKEYADEQRYYLLKGWIERFLRDCPKKGRRPIVHDVKTKLLQLIESGTHLERCKALMLHGYADLENLIPMTSDKNYYRLRRWANEIFDYCRICISKGQ